MKLLAGLFISLLSIQAQAHECRNFAREAPLLGADQKIAFGAKCSKELRDSLKKSASDLEKSGKNCEQKIVKAKELISTAKEFQETLCEEVACDQPTPRTKYKLRKTMTDLTYALSERSDERDCDHIDFIETKAEAQTELLILEETKILK